MCETNQVTPLSGVLLKKQLVSQVLKKVTACYT